MKTSKEEETVKETYYTAEVAAEICERMANGESLRAICRDANMPPESTVRTWCRDDRDGFAARYNQARAMQIDAWVDEIVETACRSDLEPNDKRVRCDAYKWIASKVLPKKYGDRLLVAGSVEDPIRVLHKKIDLTVLTAEQLDALERMAVAMLATQEG